MLLGSKLWLIGSALCHFVPAQCHFGLAQCGIALLILVVFSSCTITALNGELASKDLNKMNSPNSFVIYQKETSL
jgi:hypothetical protein